jgi:alpha-mannosidase
LEKSIHTDGPLTVKSIGSDGQTELVKTNKNVSLGTYNGELLMTRHGVGCYTSQAAMKRWNRKNELLADATERACVIADLLGVSPYPREALRDTWTRFLWHQFHDDLTGTSIPEAYQFSWNDELLCQNRFSAMLEHAVEAVASQLDTQVKGIPLMVYNPLSAWREDVVEATIPCIDTLDGKERSFMTFRVYDSGGNEVPSSVVLCDHLKNRLTINFLARVPSVGFAVYDVRPAETMCQMETGLNVTDSTLENRNYIVRLNHKGEVASIYDKAEKRELLSAPISFQFLHDKPDRWPAWEIQYTDIMAAPLMDVIKSTEVSIDETGPVRVSLAVTQKTDKSTIRTIVSLSAGDSGDRVEFDNVVDWYESETLLKVAFPVTTPNDSVTYDLGLGTIMRGINTEQKYEVPGHQWANIMAPDSSYGVTIMNDCKYGWDHPDSATLRLSLIHTPGVYESWNWVGDQKSQDMGRHKFRFAVAGHKGDWREGGAVWQAARLNQPLMAFRTTSHKGKFEKSYSFFKSNSKDLDNPQIKVTAIKKAEVGDNIVVRIQELWGKESDPVYLDFSERSELNGWLDGAEEYFKENQGSLDKRVEKLILGPYEPWAFAIKLKTKGNGKSPVRHFVPLSITYDRDGISLDANRTDGDFDGKGNTIAGELLPDTLVWLDVPYVFGPKDDGKPNALLCTGQIIPLPDGAYDRINLLVTAVGGPAVGVLKVDRTKHSMMIPDYSMPIGQWNSRLSGDEFVEEPGRIEPAYINTQPIVWYGSHRHTARGENEAYKFTYLYLYRVDLPDGAREVTLPNNLQIKVLAATLVKSNREKTYAAQPLYDRAEATVADIHSDHHNFLESTMVSISTPIPGASVFYTIDGAKPSMSSTLYASPFSIDKTTTIQARAFRMDFDDGYIAQASFNKLYPHEAAAGAGLSPGLSGRYYEGEWSKLPNFDTVAIVREFKADAVGLPSFAREEDFGLTLRGYIKVPVDGLYQFYISSDDGSKLYVSDSLAVDNDGLHGSGDVAGEIALKAGYHPLAIDMFQSKGGRDLTLSWQGPGLEKNVIPKECLFHQAIR